MVKIRVSPAVEMADEPIDISVSGLESGEKVTILSSTSNERNRLFSAHAHYIADENGQVNARKNVSFGGSYTGVEPMGLLWAMAPPTGSYSQLVRMDVTKPFIVHFKVYQGHLAEGEMELAQAVCEFEATRLVIGNNVQRMPIREGRLRGTLFIPDGPGPYPGVINLHGYDGGLVEQMPSLLASKGFVVFALAYFRYDDLPKKLEVIELEYFELAVKFLQRHKKVHKVGALGKSLGGTIVLAMAGCIPELQCAVAISAPVVNTRFPMKYRGKTYKRHVSETQLARRSDAGVVYLYGGFTKHKAEDIDQYLPPFYLSDAPILQIIGADDGLLPLKDVKAASEELIRLGGKKNSKILVFPGAGHIFNPPYMPRAPLNFIKDAGLIHFGGEPVGHSRMQEKAWKEVQDFFRQHLSDSPKL